MWYRISVDCGFPIVATTVLAAYVSISHAPRSSRRLWRGGSMPRLFILQGGKTLNLDGFR